jgi:hypothetical protein
MPHDIKIVSANEFVRTNAKVEFDLEETKNLLLTVLSKMKDANIYDVVLDVREAYSKMTGVEVLKLFTHLHHLGSLSNRRIAIVYRPKDDLDRAKMFEVCAQKRGYQVGAFQDFEEAITWLYPPKEL